MARDHRRLRVFHAAHELTLAIYRETRNFPRDEWFGIRAQLRRGATSIPSNIVEGSARRSVREYCSFLNVARGSAAEVGYLVDLATELDLFSTTTGRVLREKCSDLIPQLQSLIRQVENLERTERAQRPKPTA